MKCKKGYKQKNGKCVKGKGLFSFSNRKESNNPFKMWGSYVGAILLFITILPKDNLGYYNFYYVTIWQTILHLPSLSFSPIILTIILGFLLGWIITILWRKFRR